MNDLINKIHNCKNQDILPLIKDKSIQCFIEDMPYNLTACHWDKKQDLKEYWELRLSKLKDNGCFVLFGSEPFSSYLRMSNIKMYKYDWIWEKSKYSNFLCLKNMPAKNYENVIIYYLSKPVYNPQMREGKPYFDKGREKSLNNQQKIGCKSYTEIINNGERFPNCIIKFNNGNNKNIHPTQKPVALFEYLIKTYSNENDLIFDGFSGSGTTAIASQNLKRNFICCELDKTYYDKSIERLNEVKNNLFKDIL